MAATIQGTYRCALGRHQVGGTVAADVKAIGLNIMPPLSPPPQPAAPAAGGRYNRRLYRPNSGPLRWPKSLGPPAAYLSVARPTDKYRCCRFFLPPVAANAVAAARRAAKPPQSSRHLATKRRSRLCRQGGKKTASVIGQVLY